MLWLKGHFATAIKINCASNYVHLEKTNRVALQETNALKEHNSLHGLFFVKKKKKEKQKVKNSNISKILCNYACAESRIRMVDVIYPIKNYEWEIYKRESNSRRKVDPVRLDANRRLRRRLFFFAGAIHRYHWDLFIGFVSLVLH